MTNKEMLNLKIDNEYFDDSLTIRGYLLLLLSELWEQGECFSGTRPFGNSDWEWDLYKPLIKAGVIQGEEDFNEAEARQIIAELIKDI